LLTSEYKSIDSLLFSISLELTKVKHNI